LSRPEQLDEADVATWLATRPRWRLERGHLWRDVHTSTYPSAIELLAAQVLFAERLNHHPIVTVGYKTLTFELWTHDRDGITQLDLDYAEALDNIIASDFADVVVLT
jgi:4a-hydroxytetrahydrobiopterin dehydratase